MAGGRAAGDAGLIVAAMPFAATRPAFALAVSLALHALVIAWIGGQRSSGLAERPTARPAIAYLKLLPPPAVEPVVAEPVPQQAAPTPAPAIPPRPAITVPADPRPDTPPAARPPATQAAPPAPTAEAWAFAGRYALKNSKAYRYTWGQQVRSMMGTAVEGPDQGLVRFRVEIAPDGSLASLETLWSTSPVAERLARQAIAQMPRWPATPTGRPLVFERTISFSPFATDDPPLYRYDCLPDPPIYRNPFAWDGRSDHAPPAAAPAEPPDPQALEECLRQLPPDSIEAEMARDRRLMERWGWGSSRLGP